MRSQSQKATKVVTRAGATACMLWTAMFGWGAQVTLARENLSTIKLEADEVIEHAENEGGWTGQYDLLGYLRLLYGTAENIRDQFGGNVLSGNGGWVHDQMWVGPLQIGPDSELFWGLPVSASASVQTFWEDGSPRGSGDLTATVRPFVGEVDLVIRTVEGPIERTWTQTVSLVSGLFGTFGLQGNGVVVVTDHGSAFARSSSSYQGGWSHANGISSLTPDSDPNFDDEAGATIGSGCPVNAVCAWAVAAAIVIIFLAIVCYLFCWLLF